MKRTNLEDSPQYLEKTLLLIENSFKYNEDNSFATDFYPLMNKDNHKNCHILIDNDSVVAHIGALARTFTLENRKFPFVMFGGIAVNDAYRGQGKFKDLFELILEDYQRFCFSLLWSEKTDLYLKFCLYPCIELNQYPAINNNESYPQLFDVHQAYLIDLESEELERVKQLYLNHSELRVDRDEKSWKELLEITSSELYLVYSNEDLINYFFKNKGQDLTEIIHEYGYINKEQLELMQNYGHVWSPQNLKKNTALLASLMRIGDHELFKDFIKAYTPINIQSIGENIKLNFNGELIEQSTEDFLLGVFGPGRFEEISAPPLFISGLDSI